MSNAGRRPLPTSWKVMTGNPGKRPLPDAEPQAAVELPEPPTDLDEEALEEWKRVGELLVRNKIITALDRTALEAYCRLYSRWRKAERKVQELGEVVKSPSGYPIQNPYLGVASRALDQLRSYLIEFGLTPAARSKVRVAFVGQSNDGRQAFFDF